MISGADRQHRASQRPDQCGLPLQRKLHGARRTRDVTPSRGAARLGCIHADSPRGTTSCREKPGRNTATWRSRPDIEGSTQILVRLGDAYARYVRSVLLPVNHPRPLLFQSSLAPEGERDAAAA